MEIIKNIMNLFNYNSDNYNYNHFNNNHFNNINKKVCDDKKIYNDKKDSHDKKDSIDHNKIHNNHFNAMCPKFKTIPLIIPHQQRVIAIGDIHGDLRSAITLLIVGKLIKEVSCSTFTNLKEIIYIFKNNKLEKITKKISLHEANTIKHNYYETVYRYYKNNSSYYIKISVFNTIKWYKWIGTDSYVVQVGDQIDRCRPLDKKCINTELVEDEDSDIEIMLLFDSLDMIARKHNGRVFSLLGNHEMMNVVGDLRYVSQQGLVNFSDTKSLHRGEINRKKVFRNIISKKMACTRPTILIIGNYLFVHAGIINDLAEKYKLTDINIIIRNYLNNFKGNDEDIEFVINSSSTSPLWYRGMGFLYPDNYKYDETCKDIFENVIDKINEKNLNVIKISGMVIGHTPQFLLNENINGITSACNKKLFRVDIGISKAFNNIVPETDQIKKARTPSVLEILTNLETKESTTNILY